MEKRGLQDGMGRKWCRVSRKNISFIVTFFFILAWLIYSQRTFFREDDGFVPAISDMGQSQLEIEEEIVFFGELNEKEVRLNREMFFFVSDGLKDLQLHDACIVEAAARLHPTRRVFVLFITPDVTDVFKSKSLSALLSYENIFLRHIKLKKFMVNPVVKKWFLDSGFQKTESREKFLNDVLTFVMLDKFGGTVLDFDGIFIKPLPFEKIFFSRCTDDSILTRPLSLNSRHPILSELQSSLMKDYVTENPESIGSDLVTSTLKRICHVDFIKELLFKECAKSAWIMPVEMICPIPERRSNLIFNPSKKGVIQKELDSTKSVAMKLWTSKFTPGWSWGGPNSTTIFWALSEEACPIIRQIVGTGHF